MSNFDRNKQNFDNFLPQNWKISIWITEKPTFGQFFSLKTEIFWPKKPKIKSLTLENQNVDNFLKSKIWKMLKCTEKTKNWT